MYSAVRSPQSIAPITGPLEADLQTLDVREEPRGADCVKLASSEILPVVNNTCQASPSPPPATAVSDSPAAPQAQQPAPNGTVAVTNGMVQQFLQNPLAVPTPGTLGELETYQAISDLQALLSK